MPRRSPPARSFDASSTRRVGPGVAHRGRRRDGTRGTGYWEIIAFALGPDLTLLAGAGEDLQPQQLHPRAVGAYNLAHRLWGPAALIAVGAAIPGQAGWLLGGLAWGFHIALDRALGLGLRTATGIQRD